MIKYHAVILLLVAFCGTLAVHANKRPEFVSMAQLLGSPDKYKNKIVVVHGYLHAQFEDSALYLTKEHSMHQDSKSAIWVSYAEIDNLTVSYASDGHTINANDPQSAIKLFDRSWVSLMGTFTFKKNGDGHFGMYSGTIENVTKLVSRQSLPPQGEDPDSQPLNTIRIRTSQ